MKRLMLTLALVLSTACGAPPEPPKTPDEPPAPAAEQAPPAEPAQPAEAPPAAPAAAPAAPPAAAPAAGSGLSRSALDEANKMVMAAYPAPFDKTFKAVVAKIGEPKKKGENMNQWFSSDGGKCVQFFMTKDSKKGHAASGIFETDPADCK